MACSAPSARRRMTMRGRPSSRSSRTRWPAKATMSRIRRPGLCAQDLAPVRHLRGRHGGLANAEVLRAGRVRHDEQPVAVVIHGVLVAMLARSNQPQRALRRVGIDQIDFVGLVVVGIDGDEPARLGLADADVEADVLFLIDQRVLLGRRADPVPVDEQRAMVVVETDVEQGAAVAGPDQWRCAYRGWRRAGPRRSPCRGCGW